MTDENPRIKLETTLGTMVLELDKTNAPVTTENFLRYVEDGFFDGRDDNGPTIFHRVIPNFMVQGGGFTEKMKQKASHAAIINEGSNGLRNDRGTIAMARTNNPNSATSQFFINVKDNGFLNYKKGANPGYAVFGKVIEGMEVVDEMVSVKTARSGMHDDVPVEPVIITSAKVAAEQ